MNDVIEVSYTGDLLAHRRCSRAWAYEKHAGFNPYEQVQAMEGRLVHHAMEWLTRKFADEYKRKRHATADELLVQLDHYFKVLWARGIRTTFESKRETLDRVCENLFPGRKIHPTVKAVIEGARHTEYELRSVRKLIKAGPGGKRKLLLTGVLDLVVQQNEALEYAYTFEWTNREKLEGRAVKELTSAKPNDVEIWDYKGSKASTPYVTDYVRQLLTYAHLYQERTSELPARCVLYFVNEKERAKQLLAVNIDEDLIGRAIEWTLAQVDDLQRTIAVFQKDPHAVSGGDRVLAHATVGQRVSEELGKQCTACGRRFDCSEYVAHLKKATHPDVNVRNIYKN